ncbi:hypothetical protein [Pararhizobium sp. PWRC1-1]|uniref:hypothetical protein n=1 Tax=Pararhizobium sp. PWRC1-1 TaxID=2804566 RepID=UPI003CF1D41E
MEKQQAGTMTAKQEHRMKVNAAKAPGWVRSVAAAKCDPAGEHALRRDHKLRTFGPASECKRIDPTVYLPAKAAQVSFNKMEELSRERFSLNPSKRRRCWAHPDLAPVCHLAVGRGQARHAELGASPAHRSAEPAVWGRAGRDRDLREAS